VKATIFSVSIVLSMILFVGCQRSSDLGTTVSGTVTVDNKPLSGAIITLEPLGGTTGPNASATIFNGQFEMNSSARLHGGSYRVRISMVPADLLATIPGDGVVALPPPDLVISPAYDADSQLSCELARGQNNPLQFNVEFSKPKR
jgi:hypothetical protein